jgi:hypothetical protein
MTFKIPVPLFDLKVVDEFGASHGTNFKSAALGKRRFG